MFRNYMKIMIRKLWKQKNYAFINIIGFTIGIASSLLILLYVAHELSYDRFHTNADRIYRIEVNGRLLEKEANSAMSGAPYASAFMEEFPQVKVATRIDPVGDGIVKTEEQVFNESGLMYADEHFFQVFSFTLVQGDPGSVLKNPRSVVLTESTARRYFNQENPLGKMVRMDNEGDAYQVTGVVQDVPENSHFDFDILISMAGNDRYNDQHWLSLGLYTYVLMREDADLAAVKSRFPALYERHFGPIIVQYFQMSYAEFLETGDYFRFILMPLSDIHFHSRVNDQLSAPGNLSNIYIFSAIALFILLIASINFMNLSTARSAGRAREVGMRKVLGSDRRKLFWQFMGESILYSMAAMILAIGLVELLLVPFNNFAGITLSFGIFEHWWMPLGLLLLGLLVGLISGSYPALYLARFQPAQVLKGIVRDYGSSGKVRNGLVVFQFTISIGLILSTLIVYQQLQFEQQKNLGFTKENVLVVNNANRLGQQKETFRQALTNEAGVMSASICDALPARGGYSGTLFKAADPEAANGKVTYSSDDLMFNYFWADEYYIETLGLDIKTGRNFSRGLASVTSAVLINESVATSFGWEDPVGKQFYATGMDGSPEYRVIGIVEDYHFESLRNQIQPVVMMHGTGGNQLAIRLHPGDMQSAVNRLENKWRTFVPEVPFNYSFLDQDFDALFRAELQFGKLVGYFTLLTIFIAALGALGLAAYSAEQRTKEIGIRKALGATVSHIIFLLSKDFSRLVFIAFLIASPVAYLVMHRWLQDFAYRTEIGVSIFLLAGVLAFGIILVSVGWQSIRAATSNPTNSLRYE
ncbi:MAG: FtsX-like permease family protein [Candidatus Marinimicrobia bacterium]|nr:FtsX-like permease family protein [Candidatus Neomarinimicrobiota bacterium]